MKDKVICSCGFAQSFPIPHEHDRTDRENEIINYLRTQIDALKYELLKEKNRISTVSVCNASTFHGIDCLEDQEQYGFEGCYNDDINHPDPRPGHAIWIKKLDAEKLLKLFASCVKPEVEDKDGD